MSPSNPHLATANGISHVEPEPADRTSPGIASGAAAHGQAQQKAAEALAERISRSYMNGSAQLDGVQHPSAAAEPETAARSKVTAASVKALFQEQQRYMNNFFDNLTYEPIEKLCQACLECEGTVIFTGVGKSGFIAHKISQTLVSTGTRAVFLSPTDALHGDIGIVHQGDLLIAFSKSGGSEELLKLLPFAKAKGATLVSVTSMPGCKMEALCDLAIVLPLERELCPFDLAPVTSTAIQMLFGDTVAIALMQAKQLTMEQYAANHPAGRIGKRLILRVADLMVSGDALPLVQPDTRIVDVLAVLSSKGQGCVLIADGAGGLAGAFTDGDLRRGLQARGPAMLDTKVGDVMTRSPRTCRPDLKAADAMQAMEAPTKVTFLPVVDAGCLVGLIPLHGLVSAGL